MQQARSWTTAEDRRDPAEQPRRVDRKSRQQREHEKDRDRPVQETRVNRMSQQLAAMHASRAKLRELATRLLVKVFGSYTHSISFRPASISSVGPVLTSGGSGCGSFGP